MILVDEKRPKKEALPAVSLLQDPWVDWKPQWQEKDTPHPQQELHSPTEEVLLRLAAEKETLAARRRIADARLWNAMTLVQQDAAIAIANSHELMGRGLGYVASNWHRIPGCRSSSNVSEAHARMISTYMDWAKACATKAISHACAVDVLCYGFSCRMIDRDRRLKNGSTRKNLMKALTLYAELCGRL